MRYAFFSAANAAALQEARREAEAIHYEREAQTSAPPVEASDEPVEAGDCEEEEEEEGAEDDIESDDPVEEEEEEDSDSDSSGEAGEYLPIEEEEVQDPRTRVLSVLELEDLFIRSAPDLSSTLTCP